MDMEEAISKSLKVLNYKEIRPNQKTVVQEYMQGHDVLFCSPTGSGKSLTFEIAPFVFKYSNQCVTKCTVIVVSPLVALMQSQTDNLVRKGVKAVYLQDVYMQDNVDDNNTLKLSLSELCEGEADIIFASPESLLGDHRSLLIQLSSKQALKAVFIDEAHCIKKYGKGDKKKKIAAFRPMYGLLGEIRSLVQRHIPVIALTATASESTRQTIKKDLCMTECKEIIVNPEKPNVKYCVELALKDIVTNFKWLHDMLLTSGEGCPSIIIFFRQIKQIAEVFEYLQTSLGDKQYVNIPGKKTNGYWNRLFAMFHLTTSDHIKKCVSSSFQEENGPIRIVLCSTSFSMGLDIKQVHTVIHYGPANDLDDYLQETGRAGRDPSTQCNAILFKYTRCLTSQNITPEMKQFVKASTCRRVLLLKPFCDSVKPLTPMHNCCDICATKCRCMCTCSELCTCIQGCPGIESFILSSIRESFINNQTQSSSESSDEQFSSDSDLEQYFLRKACIIASSESD